MSVSLAIISLWSMRDSSSTSSSDWADSRASSDFGDLRGEVVGAESVRHGLGSPVPGGLEAEAIQVMVNLNRQLTETQRSQASVHV